jgi:hypothetical protein
MLTIDESPHCIFYDRFALFCMTVRVQATTSCSQTIGMKCPKLVARRRFSLLNLIAVMYSSNALHLLIVSVGERLPSLRLTEYREEEVISYLNHLEGESEQTIPDLCEVERALNQLMRIVTPLDSLPAEETRVKIRRYAHERQLII